MSNVGSVRSHNEDAYLCLPESGLWLVADGMGGHALGELASRKIVESFQYLSPSVRLAQLVNDVYERLRSVNESLRHEARERQSGIIGSTVVAMLTSGRHCVSMWAGDSRVYRYREGQLVRLTRDHRLIEELNSGKDYDPFQEKHYNHIWANQLTRAVGASERLDVDAEIREVLAGDRYLLCSDGLYEEVSEGKIKDFMAMQDITEACSKLVESAINNGGHDNITVILLKAEDGSL